MYLKSRTQAKIRNAQEGFTLMEAVVSLVIISFLVVSLSAGIGYGFRNAQFVREDARATQLINEKIDKLRLLTWDDLQDSSVTADTFYCTFDPTDDDMGEEGVTNLKGAGKYKKKALVYVGSIDVNAGPTNVVYGTNMLTLKVKLKWTSSNGMEREREISTLVSKYGIQNYVL